MWNIKAKGKSVEGEEWKARARGAAHPPTLLHSSPFTALLVAAFCLLSFGCRMDMQDQPRYEVYEPGDRKFFGDGAASRAPVEGTVPRQAGGQYRDRDEYLLTGKAAGAPGQQGAQSAAMLSSGGEDVRGNAAGGVPGARESAATGGPDVFPFGMDEGSMKRGQERYNIYCSVCHGATGEGDGMIVRRGYRRPPSFFEDRLQENKTPAAHFFDVITNGWGAMPAYADTIPAEDRWKVIAYIRALQLARGLKLEELSPEDRGKVTSGAQQQQHGAQTQGGARAGGEGEKH